MTNSYNTPALNEKEKGRRGERGAVGIERGGREGGWWWFELEREGREEVLVRTGEGRRGRTGGGSNWRGRRGGGGSNWKWEEGEEGVVVRIGKGRRGRRGWWFELERGGGEGEGGGSNWREGGEGGGGGSNWRGNEVVVVRIGAEEGEVVVVVRIREGRRGRGWWWFELERGFGGGGSDWRGEEVVVVRIGEGRRGRVVVVVRIGEGRERWW